MISVAPTQGLDGPPAARMMAVKSWVNERTSVWWQITQDQILNSNLKAKAPVDHILLPPPFLMCSQLKTPYAATLEFNALDFVLLFQQLDGQLLDDDTSAGNGRRLESAGCRTKSAPFGPR